MNTAYVERSGNMWECWTYAEGKRHYLIRSFQYGEIDVFCKCHGYKLVHVR